MKPARDFAPCEVWNCSYLFQFDDCDLKTARARIHDHYINQHPYGATSELMTQVAVVSPVSLFDYIGYYTQQAFWRLVRTEWHENWAAWPHCNGQGGCWTHTSSRWCGCKCWWCRAARRLRPGFHREST